MGSVQITFPTRQLRAEASGFRALGKLHESIQTIADSAIVLDCQDLVWLDAHLAAPLKTIFGHSHKRSNTIQFKGLNNDVRTILSKNGMLKRKELDNFHTTIPVTSFGLDQEVDFASYSRRHLARKEMPRMSSQLRGKFFEGIDELFANCALHSLSPIKVVAAGQFFPRGERLAFCLSDGGRGIDGSLTASGIGYSSPEEAIDWAMQSNNTTRQGDIPGGLGLKLLREFIEKNGGRLIVVSSAGYWCQNGASVRKVRLAQPFPGTVVIMEIVTSDHKSYDLVTASNPRDIW